MQLAHWLWLATAVYAIHALEEMILDWRDWARAVIGLPVEWSHFYVVNFLVVVLGVVAANLAPVAPGVALGFAALMVVNALAFHVAPFLRSAGRRYSPRALHRRGADAAGRGWRLPRGGDGGRADLGRRRRLDPGRRGADGHARRAADHQGQALFPAGRPTPLT